MSRYKLTDKGWAAYCRMENMYYTELDLIRHETNDPNYEDGWSIIDDYDHIHTWDDDIDLLIFGYDDDAIYHLAQFAQDFGRNEKYGFGHTAIEYISRIAERGLLEVV